MDTGTTRDFIQDLQEENARLHQAIANLCNEMVVLESERDEWRNMANRLGTHMGEGLYTDDWEAREYAISAYYEWQSHAEAKLYAYDKPAEPVWYFKGGAL